MDVDLIFKIAAVGILVAVLNQVLSRAGREEQAMMTTLAGDRRPVRPGEDLVPPVMDGMVQVAAVGVTAALLAGVLRRGAPEFSLVLVLCAGAWMLLTAADSLGAAVALMEELSALAGLDEALLEPVVKTVALSILTRLTAEVCRASGEGGLAAFVETAGTILALGAALPLARAVTSLLAEMLT